jgi:hypothetical protein
MPTAAADDDSKFTLPPLRVAIDGDPNGFLPRKTSRSPPGSAAIPILGMGAASNSNLPPTLPLPVPAHPMQMALSLSSSAGPPLGPYMGDTRRGLPMTARQAP